MMWGYNFGWGGMSLMIMGITLWIALLAILVWALVHWLNKKASGAVPPAPHLPQSGPSALEILQQRYARGEIDTATFEQMREQFGASPHSSYQNPPRRAFVKPRKGSLLVDMQQTPGEGAHHFPQLAQEESDPNRSESNMNILVYGAGVIGSVYAARLQEAGYYVTLLARGRRAVALRTQGILLEDASTGQRTTTQVSVIERLAPTDTFDVVLVTVRMDQLASILPTLAANHQIPTVLFMLNNPAGMQRLEMLEAQRIVLGFPEVGGTRQGEVVRYVRIRQQKTTLGEVDGRVTPRMQQLATAFKKAGFSVALSPDMQAWLKMHVIFVSCIAAALAMEGGDSVRLGHSRKSVVMMVKAIHEGCTALQALGMPISPFNLKVIFTWMPRWFAVLYWQYALRTTIGTLTMAPHAKAACDEMQQVAVEIMEQLQTASVPTPTLSHLLTFLASPVSSTALSDHEDVHLGMKRVEC